MINTLKTKIAWARQHPNMALFKALPVLVMVAMFVAVMPSFAQVPSLNLDPDTLVTGLFNGANIILAVLGGIMFLLAGFKLGGILLRGIVDAVSNIRF